LLVFFTNKPKSVQPDPKAGDGDSGKVMEKLRVLTGVRLLVKNTKDVCCRLSGDRFILQVLNGSHFRSCTDAFLQ
jgi:hypothetical protein